MKQARKPRPLTLLYRGQYLFLMPFELSISELKRVRDWLNRAIAWKEALK